MFVQQRNPIYIIKNKFKIKLENRTMVLMVVVMERHRKVRPKIGMIRKQ